MYRIKVEMVKMSGKSKTKRDPEREKIGVKLYMEQELFAEEGLGEFLGSLFAASIIKEWKKTYPKDIKLNKK